MSNVGLWAQSDVDGSDSPATLRIGFQMERKILFL